MKSHSRCFPDALVHCIGTGEPPTNRDIESVALRIWLDTGAGRCRSAWDRLDPNHPERAVAMTLASAALNGLSYTG